MGLRGHVLGPTRAGALTDFDAAGVQSPFWAQGPPSSHRSAPVGQRVCASLRKGWVCTHHTLTRTHTTHTHVHSYNTHMLAYTFTHTKHTLLHSHTHTQTHARAHNVGAGG